MPHSSEVIISDTSCLILLCKIDELDLLKKMANKVYVTPTIKKEFGKGLPDWITINSPSDNHYQKILEMDLDPGEASAIALVKAYLKLLWNKQVNRTPIPHLIWKR